MSNGMKYKVDCFEIYKYELILVLHENLELQFSPYSTESRRLRRLPAPSNLVSLVSPPRVLGWREPGGTPEMEAVLKGSERLDKRKPS